MNKSILDNYIKPKTVMIFSKSWCPFCDQSKNALKKIGVKFDVLEIDLNPLSSADLQRLNNICGFSTVPKIFIGKNCIGGNSDLLSYVNSGEINEMLEDEGIL